MALFRPYRNTITESFKSTRIVKDYEELYAQIWMELVSLNGQNYGFLDLKDLNDYKFSIKVILPNNLDLKSAFDSRCGWYTHYVLADLFEKDQFIVVGFLSEPMDFR